MDIITAHKFSSKNRESILKSKTCGCFFCLHIFPTNEIIDWCDNGENIIRQTAICPKCGIDSLIGDFDLNLDNKFLTEMNKYWFNKKS